MWSHTLKNASLPIVFILSTQSVHPMRVRNSLISASYDFWFQKNRMCNFRDVYQNLPFWEKKIDKQKKCSIKVGEFLLINEICTSCYSGTRIHRRLIFRIMNSHGMNTLCTKYENNRKWCIFWVCDFTWNDPDTKALNWKITCKGINIE